MAEKNIKSRIVHKHDTESNWSKATTFIPKQGEIIIYDIDSNHSYERFKIGDGITKVNNLPFADANKVDKISGKGLSTNDYTTAEKNKLASIAEGANKTIVDSELSSTSTDPVQNKVVNAAINDLNTLVGDTAVATQISNAVASKADASHTHDDRYYTESEIDTKLSGKSDTSHTHSAYVNQNAFSNIKVGNTTVAADTATDTVTLVAGNNITITPDATNDKVTIAATDTVYTHPSSGVTVGTYKSVTVNAQGHVTGGSNPTTLSGYGITDAATKSALTAVSDLVGDTAVSAQISDYAAPKSHTHSYLPLSGGTVTGTLTVNEELYSNAAVISKRNSNPQLILQNASGANLAMLYSNGTNGGYSNAVLRVYSSASEYSSFSFGKDGQFTAPNDINTGGGLYAKGGIFSTTNAYPGLKIRDASYKQLALLQSNTANGGYSDFVIGVASKEDAWSYFTFKTSGIFVAPSDIISNGGILKSSRNTNPCLALTNQAGAWLASLAATTSDGSYGNTQLAVYKSATESSTFTFSNQGSFRAPSTVYSSLFAVQSNNNPQIALQNNNGANLGMLYMNTAYGSYTNACLRVYSSASAYSTFSFGNDGKLSCGSLALTTALPISSGGTGSTTASGALANLGALPITGGTLTGPLNLSGSVVITLNSKSDERQFMIRNSTNTENIYLCQTASARGIYSTCSAGGIAVLQAKAGSNEWTFNGVATSANTLNNTLSIEKGGTGATTAADARTNLGITPANIGAAASSHTHSYLPLSGGTISGSIAVTGNVTSNGKSVYTAGGNVIYSSTQPTGSTGMIWLKPV